MTKMLMGAFEDRDRADRALLELEEQGYTPEQISVISTTNRYEHTDQTTPGDEAIKSAGTGAVAGGVLGGLAGLLASVGVMPALAGLFVGGPILAALGLVGAAATTTAGALTGAAAGGLIGALMALGFSKETAASYDEVVKKGGVVLGLSGQDEATNEARRVLEKYGARDINVIDMHESSMGAGTVDGPIGRPQPVFGERRDAGRDK